MGTMTVSATGTATSMTGSFGDSCAWDRLWQTVRGRRTHSGAALKDDAFDEGEDAVAMSNVLTLAAQTVEHSRSLPFSAETFGAVALIAFGALLGLTWSFRNTSNRHR